MDVFAYFWHEVVRLWTEISFYLLTGMAIAGVLHVYVRRNILMRHMGGTGIVPIIKSALFGIPIPVCSCGVMPLAAGLRKEGIPSSNVLAFMVSTPVTGVDSILATYSLMGPLFAIFRPLAALISGVVVGVLDFMCGGKREKISPQAVIEPVVFSSGRLQRFFTYAFVDIPRDIGLWLIIGTMVAGIISVAMPESIFAGHVPIYVQYSLALIAGIPAYVCATASIPVAVSLMAKGFSPGAALIFLIVGPATNAITLSFVRARLGKRSFYVYVIGIVASAVVCGFVFDALWAHVGSNAALTYAGGQMLPGWLRITSACLLAVVVVHALWPRQQRRCCRGAAGAK